MSDYEEIQLVGGPADGRLMPWDGGNFLQIEEKPTTLLGKSTQAFRDLMVRRHTYVRDSVQRDRFVWQGEPA